MTVQHRRVRDDFQKQCQFIQRQYKYGTIKVSILHYLSISSNIFKHITLSYPKKQVQTETQTYSKVFNQTEVPLQNLAYTLRTENFPLAIPRALTTPFLNTCQAVFPFVVQGSLRENIKAADMI